MKNTKRLFAFLLATLMIISCVPLGVFATEAEAIQGVTADETTPLSPVAETYVSAANPKKVYGTENKLYADNQRTYFATFKTADFKGTNKAYLNLPLTGDYNQVLFVYLLDGYTADETTLCYSNAPKLTEDKLLGTYKVTGGDNKLDLLGIVSDVKGEYFTLAINGSAHYFELNFDEYSSGATLSAYNSGANPQPANAPGTEKCSSADYIWRAGGATGNIKVTKNPDNSNDMVSYVTSNATWNRIRWYNSFVRDKDYFDLTDVGKVFDLSFDLRVKPADGATDLRLGYALDISGGSTSTYHPAPTANVWMTETKTFTITQNDVIKDGALTKRGLLNFSLVGTANNTYYFDDIIVKEQAPTLIEAGSAYITAEIIDESGAIADAYVSKSQPDTALGQSNRLLLNGGDDENIIFLTYSSKLIKGKKNIQFTIPAEDNASVKTEILLLDGYFVNEKELTYNNMPELSNAVSLGEYTLNGGVNTIEIDDAVAKIHGNYFTVVFKANDSVEFVLYNNFEDYKLGTDLKTTANNVTDPDNSSYSYYYGHLPNMTTGIARSGGATSGIGNVLIDPSNAGNQIVSVIMNKTAGYNGRIKFFNSISDGVLTADSPLVGQTLRFTVRAKGADEYTINNAGYSMASSMLSCGSAPLKDKNNVEVKSDSIILNDEWQSFTVDYTVRAEDIKVDTTASGNPAWGYPMFTVDFKGVAGDRSMTYFIDDVTVVKLNSDGTVSRLDMASSEGTGETIGLRARGVKDPVADTYISEVNKDGVFGLEKTVYADSKRTYLATFKTADFEKSSKTYLDLPLSGDGSQEISVYYLDGFVVDEGKTCYNNTPELTDSMLIGTYTVSNGGCEIDISKVVSNVKSDYFTIAVKGSARYFELNFEDYTSTTSVKEYSNDVADTVETDRSHMYGFADASKLKPLTTRRGGSLSTRQIKKVEGNMVFSVTASTSGYGWLKFYNFLNDNADTDLTGVTFNYSVKVKLDPSTIEVANASTQKPKVRVGILGSGENTFYQCKETDSASLLLGKWQTVTGEYTIKSGVIGKKLTSQWDPLKRFSYPMLGIEFVNVGTLVNKKNYVYYLDDISVSESAPSALVSIDQTGAKSVSVITNKDVIADTYVSKGNPDTCYGNEDVLKLGDKGGDKKALVLSYMSSAIDGNNYVDLKLNNNGDALKDVHVYYVLDYLADETALTWNTMPEYEKNLLGVYDIAAGETQINLSALKDKLTGEYFTLVLRTENHTFYEDFDSYPAGTKFVDGTSGGDNNVADTTDSSKLHYHSFFDTVYNTSQNTVITRRNGDTSERKVISDGENNMLRVVTADGATWGCKLKFYNSVNDSLITKDSDIVGKTLRFNAKVKLDTSATNQSSTSGIKVDIAAYTSYTQNALSKVYTANYTALSSDWATLSVDYTVSADDIMEPLTSSGKTNYSYPIFGLSFNDNDGSASNKYLVDDLTVVEVVDGEAVGDAIFGSREAHSDDISFVSALNDSVTILETTASSATTGDVFSIVDGADTYSLLTVKNGNLVFGDTVLCDEDGNDYVLGDDSIKIVAIYDDTKGTVRFAIGDYLAYYKDAEGEVRTTYDHLIISGGISSRAALGNDGIKATKLSHLTSEIIGSQTHALENSVRIVSGIDTVYFNEIGFMLESNGLGIEKEIGSAVVYSSIVADNKDVFAKDYGYNLMSALAIKDVKNGGVIKVTPFLRIGTNYVYGETVFYKITTSNGISVSEVDESEFTAPTNANLASVTVDGEPIVGFSADKLSYTVGAADPLNMNIVATAEEPEATVEIAKNENTATITVTAYDGQTKKMYTITAYEKVESSVVNKNGADAIVTYVFDDGDKTTATIVTEKLAPKYDSLTGSFALITKDLATLSTVEGVEGDGLLEYEFDENGDYVYTKKDANWEYWKTLLNKYDDSGFEGISHTHTHAYIGENDNGGSFEYKNTSGNVFTSEVFPIGNVRKEYYASNQILRALGERALTMVGAGLTAGGAMIDYTDNYRELPQKSGAFIGKRSTYTYPTTPDVMVNNVSDFLDETNRFNVKSYMVQHYNTSSTAPKNTNASNYSKDACMAAGVEYWTNYIDEAVKMGGWAAFCFHNIRDDSHTGTTGHFVYQSQADAVFKYTDDLAKENKVWVANFTDACLYMFERSTAELDAYIDGDGNVVVSLNDKENDEIFTMPLTVKVALPTEKTVAKLGETTLNTFTDNGNTYVYVDVIPGHSVTITVE